MLAFSNEQMFGVVEFNEEHVCLLAKANNSDRGFKDRVYGKEVTESSFNAAGEQKLLII